MGTTRLIRPARAARPTRRKGYGTTQARGATFAGQSRGVAITLLPQKAPGPLGHLAGRFGAYSPVCQGWIALTLKDPHFGPKVNFHNVGTGPELVTCGYFLARGYQPERNISFQEDKIYIDDRTRTSRKLFVVDVEIDSPWAGFVYLNIDGNYFHTRTELEQFRDALRDRAEGRTGRAVDVPDLVCYDDRTFVSFLEKEGVIP